MIDEVEDILFSFSSAGELTSQMHMISRQSDKQRMLDGLQPNWPYEPIAVKNTDNVPVTLLLT